MDLVFAAEAQPLAENKIKKIKANVNSNILFGFDIIITILIFHSQIYNLFDKLGNMCFGMLFLH
jgi:hypothetical protein